MNLFFEEDLLNHYPRSGITVYQYELMHRLPEYQDCQIVSGQVTLNPRNISRTGMVLKKMGHHGSRRIIPCPGRLAKYPPFSSLIQQYFLAHIDIVHLMDGILPAWWNPRHSGKPTLLVTIHDLVIFRYRNGVVPVNPDFAIQRLKAAVAAADKVVTVSEFSRREAIECLHLPEEKIIAIPIASQFSPAEITAARSQAGSFSLSGGHPFFLAVSVLSPRKNYETLLNSWNIFFSKNPEYRLVIIGRPGWNCENIHQRIKTTPGILYFESVSKEALICCYSQSLGYFNLSYYEGFGIPVHEAMLCGCPVCHAKGSSMDEVAGSAGIGVDHNDVEQVLHVMQVFQDGYREKSEIKEALKEQSSKFSWDKTVCETYNLYKKMAIF